MDAEEDKTIAVGAVKTVGRKTFFLRDGAWTDSTLSPQQKKNPRRIRRFSRAYFDLFDTHGGRAAKYLAMEGTVLITLDGQTYLLADE